jgi:hypothetical protein
MPAALQAMNFTHNFDAVEAGHDDGNFEKVRRALG